MPATSLLSCEHFRLACLAREGVAEVTRLLEFALHEPNHASGRGSDTYHLRASTVLGVSNGVRGWH